jgi:hypothetical protein
MKVLVRSASVGSSSSAGSATPRNRQLRRLPDGSRRRRLNAGFCYQHVHSGHDGADSSVHALALTSGLCSVTRSMLPGGPEVGRRRLATSLRTKSRMPASTSDTAA